MLKYAERQGRCSLRTYVRNQVGNEFAISQAGISEALRRSSAAMREAGNEMEETIGLVVAANQAIQDPQVVGV